MAYPKREPSPTSSPRTAAKSMDPLDIDQYINQDNLVFASPTMQSTETKQPDISSSTHGLMPANMQPSRQPSQTFTRPSHQYEQYKQQASLPVGAVANTFALNEAGQFGFGSDPFGLMSPNANFLGMADDFMHFPNQPSDMDIDFSTPPPRHGQMLASNVIDPASVAGRSSASAPHPQQPPQQQQQPMRVYVGMHQQLAAEQQAKAQAQAQAQAQRQQMRQQSASRPRASSNVTQRQTATDSHVQDSISRLLDRMRHGSVASSQSGGDPENLSDSPQQAGGRLRKDEDDMDEDERLLASEEGKKLSSKERRQLRNKVSARAFRSRRKEYISQLEGEIAQKTAEAQELQKKNTDLMAENRHLVDLTKMLLSSPHFSGILDELSASGAQFPEDSSTSQPQQSSSRKGPGPNNNLHIGLAMIPESPYEQAGNDAGSAFTTPHGRDQQVYAITSLPDEPPIDSGSLSQKAVSESLYSWESGKDSLPEFVVPPSVSKVNAPQLPVSESTDENEDDEDALYTTPPSSPSSHTRSSGSTDEDDLDVDMFGTIPLDKVFARVELTSSSQGGLSRAEEEEVRAMQRFAKVRARMDELGSRVERVVARMD